MKISTNYDAFAIILYMWTLRSTSMAGFQMDDAIFLFTKMWLSNGFMLSFKNIMYDRIKIACSDDFASLLSQRVKCDEKQPLR